MQRIMIIGGPGSGKSTLAQQLGARFGLPVFHMDREVHWRPGWVERAPAEKMPLVEAIVARERWVFEGGHSQSYALRAARADLLIWLDLPLPLRLFRVVRRSLRDLGHSRPDLPEDCPERLDMLPEFVGFMLRVRRRSRAKQQAAFRAAPCPKHHLQSPRAVNRLVAAL